MSSRLTKKFVLVLVAVSLGAAGRTWAAKPQVDEAATELAVNVNVAAATDELVPATAACDESEPLNYTPAVAILTDESLVGVNAPGCKRCKDREWCTCSYNGLPRVSCNPCCYGNLGMTQICRD